MSEKALVASGRFVKLFDGVDKWTDKETGEMRERPYTAAVVEYMGGRHVIREPYSPEEG